MPVVDISEFRRLDIRIGRIVSAERVPGTDRLIRFKVDFGGVEKQAVAGLGHIYEPEHFLGKQYAFVYNLKPRRLRGVVSECMILAATAGEEDVAPLMPEKPVPDGCQVT